MIRVWVAIVVVCEASVSPAAVLYDGSAGTLPSPAQGWVYLVDPSPTSATQTLITGGVNLNTTAATTDKAGYFSSPLLSVPTLSRTTGFTVRIDLKLLSESHVSNDRAGFSVIALSSDDHKGVELGFWSDRVWAQNTAFQHSEEGLVDTTAAIKRYDIAVKDDNYWVMVDGSYLFGGPARDYSAFGLPYNSNKFIFWGDDTSSAAGSTDVMRVEALTTAVPEPAAGTLLLLAMGMCLRRRAR